MKGRWEDTWEDLDLGNVNWGAWAEHQCSQTQNVPVKQGDTIGPAR